MSNKPSSVLSPRKFIFFDVDGVLIDGYHYNAAHRKLWNINLEKDLGIPLQTMEIYFRENWADVLVGRKDLTRSLRDFLHNKGHHENASDVMTYWFEKDSKINPDTWEIVTRLHQKKNCALYLATNQEHQRAAYLWNILNFKSMFQDIFYSGAMGVTKKRSAVFHAH